MVVSQAEVLQVKAQILLRPVLLLINELTLSFDGIFVLANRIFPLSRFEVGEAEVVGIDGLLWSTIHRSCEVLDGLL